MTPESQRKLQKLQEITAPYEALLYDVDGTLADNMLAHKLSYKAAAAEYGVDLDTDLIDETAGWPTIAVAQEIAKRYQTTFDFEVFSKRKSAIFIERFIQNTQPVDYVLAHLMANEGVKRIGVVSGGTRSTLQITLKVIDVEGRFETLVCAGDTPKGKPDPAPFLLAAKHLGVDPQKCIVLEDGDPGVQGAINAGMGWVRIDQL
ncbi:HAD family hydrolase [Sphingobacterium spiritivorum]|uniref:HAD family hydrolase n=1 Tax=Sphingobacterium spiritivorum TaxID=258 RepID=UPI00191AB7C5|nr:HAD family phosphatase [Sphingobacterium spiritivorum]QQT26267.1 HAD family phosphatase [Sphingobacterium spiritivorum]